jgi:hypothetical protein
LLAAHRQLLHAMSVPRPIAIDAGDPEGVSWTKRAIPGSFAYTAGHPLFSVT